MFLLVPVLVVGAVLGLAVLVRHRRAESPHHAQGGERAEPRRHAVRTYLRALANGDAATAIAVSSPTPTGGS